MINRQELRIGNFVRWNGGIHKVVAINEGSVTLEDLQSPHSKLIAMDKEIFPIFLHKPIVKSCPDFGPESRYNVMKTANCWDFFDDALTTRSLKRVKSLHEVQNLFFALTGREMQINAVIKALIDYKKADSG